MLNQLRIDVATGTERQEDLEAKLATEIEARQRSEATQARRLNYHEGRLIGLEREAYNRWLLVIGTPRVPPTEVQSSEAALLQWARAGAAGGDGPTCAEATRAPWRIGFASRADSSAFLQNHLGQVQSPWGSVRIVRQEEGSDGTGRHAMCVLLKWIEQDPSAPTLYRHWQRAAVWKPHSDIPSAVMSIDHERVVMRLTYNEKDLATMNVQAATEGALERVPWPWRLEVEGATPEAMAVIVDEPLHWGRPAGGKSAKGTGKGNGKGKGTVKGKGTGKVHGQATALLVRRRQAKDKFKDKLKDTVTDKFQEHKEFKEFRDLR